MKSTLMIKDLSLDKQLDGREMSAVRGGTTQTASNYQDNFAVALGGAGPSIGSPTMAFAIGGAQVNTLVSAPTASSLFGPAIAK